MINVHVADVSLQQGIVYVLTANKKMKKICKSYIAENGLSDSIDTISSKTGISVKNLNRFMQMESFQDVNQMITGKKIEKRIEL